MTPDQIRALAKQAGGITTPNQAVQTVVARDCFIFSADELAEFVRLVREVPMQMPAATVVDRNGVLTASLNSTLPIGTPLYAHIIKGSDIPISEVAKWVAKEFAMLEAAKGEAK